MSASKFLRTLNILTPQVIDELTRSFTGEGKSSLTDLMEAHFEEKVEQAASTDVVKAKILPFKRPEEEEQVEAPDAIDEAYEGMSGGRSRGHQMKKVVGGDIQFDENGFEYEEEQVIEEKMDTTVFILAEQRRLKKSQEALKKKEVMSLYQKNANVSVEQERKINKEDMAKSTYSGILVNKRQF